MILKEEDALILPSRDKKEEATNEKVIRDNRAVAGGGFVTIGRLLPGI